MIRARLLLIGVIVLGVLGLSVTSAEALTCATWTGGGGDGLWSTAANWSTGVVPGYGTSPDVCLPDIGHSYTVTFEPSGGNGGITVNTLTVGAATGSDTVTLDIVGQSYIYEGETLNGDGIGVANGATINATGSVVLDATGGGTRALSSDPLGGPAGFGDSPFGGGANVVNDGRILAENSDPAWNEQLNADLTNEPGASIEVASGSLDQETSNTVTNDGTVTTDAGGDYDVTSGGTNDIFNNDASVVNNGTFEVQGQTGTFAQDGPLTGQPVTIEASAALDDVSGQGTFTLEYDNPVLIGTIPAGQTVNVRGASSVNGGETDNGTGLNLNGATVTNDGTLVLDATADGTEALSGDTVGGPVTPYNGSLVNNGALEFKVDDPAWGNVLEAGLTNASAGTVTISGPLRQDTAVATINDGTFTLTPSAVYTLLEGGSFTNAANGTLVTQIASASSLGSFVLQSPCCAGPGTVTAGGTLTPQPVGGFTPAVGEEFAIVALDGGAFTGTFPTVSDDFSSDYTHETTSPAYVGVVYGSSSAPRVDPTSTAVSCSPVSVTSGSRSTCSATVTDTSSSPSTPTGQIAFTSAPSTGSFGAAGGCRLLATGTTGRASCQVSFTPSAAGRYTITGRYGGESTEQSSGGTFSLTTVPKPGKVTIGRHAKVAKNGVARVTLKCSGAEGARCTGKLTLTERVKTKVSRKVKGHRKSVSVTKTVKIGSASYGLAAGTSESVSVKLSKPGKQMVDAARHRQLRVKASAKSSTAGTVTQTVTLTGAAPKKRGKK